MTINAFFKLNMVSGYKVLTIEVKRYIKRIQSFSYYKLSEPFRLREVLLLLIKLENLTPWVAVSDLCTSLTPLPLLFSKTMSYSIMILPFL